MMNFAFLVAGIVLGNLMTLASTTIIMIALFSNKKVLKAYTKWATKMSEEITNDLFEVSDKEEA